MFERKEEIDRHIKLIMSETSILGRGDVIPLETIEALTGCQRYTGSWWTIIKKLKREFQKTRGIEIYAKSRNEGYRLATLNEQLIERAAFRHRCNARNMTRGIKSQSALEPSLLTEHQRRVRLFQMETMKSNRRDAKRAIKNASKIKPSQTTPSIARALCSAAG